MFLEENTEPSETKWAQALIVQDCMVVQIFPLFLFFCVLVWI